MDDYRNKKIIFISESFTAPSIHNHKKVYSNELLLTDPPKIKWECSECDLVGYDLCSEIN